MDKHRKKKVRFEVKPGEAECYRSETKPGKVLQIPTISGKAWRIEKKKGGWYLNKRLEI